MASLVLAEIVLVSRNHQKRGFLKCIVYFPYFILFLVNESSNPRGVLQPRLADHHSQEQVLLMEHIHVPAKQRGELHPRRFWLQTAQQRAWLVITMQIDLILSRSCPLGERRTHLSWGISVLVLPGTAPHEIPAASTCTET